MKKFLTLITVLLCVLCGAIALAACGESASTGSTDNPGGSQTEQPGGQTPDGSQSEQPGGQEKPHEHSFTNYVYNYNATCTEDGTETATCSCGETDTRTKANSALGHDWDDGKITKPATCTTAGEKYYTCKLNHEHHKTEEIKVDPTAHSYGDWIPQIDAECEKDGVLGHFECEYCHENFDEEYEHLDSLKIEQTGHDWDSGVVTPATCTTAGQTYYTCNHNPEHHKTEEIKVDPTAHSYGDWIPQIDAECEKDGVLGHFECEYCHENFDEEYERLDSLKIEQTGHNYQQYETKEATCSEAGYLAYQVCLRCNESTLTDDKYIPALHVIYLLENGCYTVSAISSDCADAEIVIPSSYMGKPVTSVASEAFKNCIWIKNITIADGITSIGDEAFSGCKGLTGELKIPDSVTSIGSSAFEDCSGLQSVTIGSGVTSIGESAFRGCSGLTEIVIPDSVTSIGGNAFTNCGGLQSVIWNAENCTWAGSYSSSYNDRTIFQGCTNLSSVTFGENVKTIPAYAFYGCSKLTGKLYIPENVSRIGYGAFGDCGGFDAIEVSDKNTTYQGKQNCLIETSTGTLILGCRNSTIPSIVTKIESNAFMNCYELISITIPESVTSIGSGVFDNCNSLECIKVDEKNQKYSSQDGILYNKAKTEFIHIPSALQGSVVIPARISSIPSEAFRNRDGLTSVTIGSGVTSIGSTAFNGCSGLTSIDIPNSVTSIESWAFGNCSGLTSIDIPNGMISVGYMAFYNCSGLTEIVIPDSVTSIGRSAFEDCSGLQSVTIGNGVTSIGSSAFEDCSGLQSVIFCDPNGWSYNGKKIDSAVLQNPTSAAKYLKAYNSFDWTKGTSNERRST